MRFFIRTKKFKALMGVLSVVIAAAVTVAIIGGVMNPGSSAASLILTPIQKLFTTVSNAVGDTYTKIAGNAELVDENEALQEQVDELSNKLAGYEDTLNQNEFYKGFLELKEQNPDFEFAEAMVISEDSTDVYGSFTIDKGSLNGISAHDPVITSAGLIGYIDEVSLNSAKVLTILNPTVNVGGYDSRTGDTGIVTGEAAYAQSGTTRFYNVPRSSSLAIDDYVLTSGGGVFPRGLMIGTISAVSRNADDTTISAAITPAADLENLRNVMVITYFDGQGSVAAESGAGQ